VVSAAALPHIIEQAGLGGLEVSSNAYGNKAPLTDMKRHKASPDAPSKKDTT